MKKSALTTGANRGLGLEAARQLARDHNFTVLLGARDLERGEAAATELRESGLDAHAVQLEVSDEAPVKQAAREVEEKLGHIDVLINNPPEGTRHLARVSGGPVAALEVAA